MDYLIVTLFYILVVICLVYPPTEIVAAGFTIAQLFDDYLGSENTNFISFHMRRITLTLLIHSALPFGYVVCLWLAGLEFWGAFTALLFTSCIPILVGYKLFSWWEKDKRNHPVVKALLPYVEEGSDWRLTAANLNVEFKGVDKVSLQLSTTSKFIATPTWLMKVAQYSVVIVKQSECGMVVTGTDVHELSTSGEDEVQYMTIECIPSREEISRFSIRISSQALRELQPRLLNQVRLPENLSLLPTVVERFINIFKRCVEQNPVHWVDEAPELCIGCMQALADVKLNKRCSPEPGVAANQQCQTCNCRVVWCVSCMGRWWYSRGVSTDGGVNLGARCTCPVCRATFCLLDVTPVAIAPPD